MLVKTEKGNPLVEVAAMDKRTDGQKNRSRRPVSPQRRQGQNGENAQDVHPKGTMREPPQTPGAVEAEGELREVREALQEIEESAGDWSKGG
jgi:hypothetical protein